MKNYKIGDWVKLIKTGCSAKGGDIQCCKEHGYIIGKKYKITKVGYDNVDLEVLDGCGTINCTFRTLCIKPIIITTMKELLE